MTKAFLLSISDGHWTIKNDRGDSVCKVKITRGENSGILIGSDQKSALPTNSPEKDPKYTVSSLMINCDTHPSVGCLKLFCIYEIYIFLITILRDLETTHYRARGLKRRWTGSLKQFSDQSATTVFQSFLSYLYKHFIVPVTNAYILNSIIFWNFWYSKS